MSQALQAQLSNSGSIPTEISDSARLAQVPDQDVVPGTDIVATVRFVLFADLPNDEDLDWDAIRHTLDECVTRIMDDAYDNERSDRAIGDPILQKLKKPSEPPPRT
jgi:hypothetical protein